MLEAVLFGGLCQCFFFSWKRGLPPVPGCSARSGVACSESGSAKGRPAFGTRPPQSPS